MRATCDRAGKPEFEQKPALCCLTCSREATVAEFMMTSRKTVVCFLMMASVHVVCDDLFTLQVNHSASSPPTSVAGEGGTSAAVLRMTDIGNQLIASYIRDLRRGRTIDICRVYSKAGIDPQTLSHVVHRLRCNSSIETDARSAVFCALQKIHRECSGRRDVKRKKAGPNGSAVDLVCFEREYTSTLTRRCDDRLPFDLSLKTKPKQRFLQEVVDCKVSLVSSSCDEATGLFAYYLSVVLLTITRSTARILSSSDWRWTPRLTTTKYSGFRYDDNCPSYFISDVHSCYADYLEGNLVQFEQENDLIAKDDSMVTACRSFRKYKLCLRPIKKACPRGLRLFFEYENHLRKYVLKMDFICAAENLNAYTDHLQCYRNVMEHKNVTVKCSDLWRDLVPLLGSVTSYQFFCLSESTSRKAVHKQLDLLRGCHESVYETECGERGSRVLSQLIRLAFTDPHYLSYRYRPDCRLHGPRSGKGTLDVNTDVCLRQNCTESPDVDTTLEVDDVTGTQSSSGISSLENSGAAPMTSMRVMFGFTIAIFLVFHSNGFC